MKYAVFGMVSLFFSGVFPGCGSQGDRLDEGEDSPAIRTLSQGLSSDPRTRMVQEASYAMWGHYNANATNWPEGTRYATYAYTNQDRGAWDKLMNALVYDRGNMVSCVGNFSPCGNMVYGARDMPYYTCQGYCPASVYRGGQCKAFANLVAYRSGVYQNPGYAFRDFPGDGRIESQPLATHGGVQPGDILRRTTSNGSPHAVIVVSRLSWPRILVVDSNWVGGAGNEIVGSHEMRFGDTNPVANPGTYRVMSCIYDKSC